MPVIEIYDLPAEVINQVQDGLEFNEDEPGLPDQMCMLMRKPVTADGTGYVVSSYLPLDISAEDAEEIRWYLECYVQEPFEKARAHKALEKLYDHARGIIRSINWDSIFPAEMREETLILRIQAEDANRQNHVFWELLERAELWHWPNPPKVLVIRAPFSDLDALVSFYQEEITTFNILLVSARPNAKEDVPHRLVANVLLEMVNSLPSTCQFTASLEIVRPATFASLQQHLSRYPKGHFRLVHLDMHGVEDSAGSTHLRFLKEGKDKTYLRIEPDDVKAEELGKLLASHGVRYAVLNACRSAKGVAVDSNIAMSLLRSGVWACVAMSFNFVARSVQIFSRIFYEALLHRSVSFDYAAILARQALNAVRDRTSRFGETVQLDDSMVPVVYLHGRAPWTFRTKMTNPLVIPNEEAFQPKSPFGRDDDILKIESALLIGGKPVLLTGQAAVGKSALIDHVGSWWLATSMVDDGCIFRLSNDEPWTADAMYKKMSHKFLPEELYTGAEPVLQFLKTHRVLVVLDGLDTITLPTGKITRKQRKDLIHLIEQLTDEKCFLILTSRAKETWLGGLANPIRLSGLGSFAGGHYFETVLETESKSWGFKVNEHTKSLEDKQFVEQLVKLVDGNPLAIRILASNFGVAFKPIKDFFMDLLSGAPMFVNRPAMKSIEGWRSMAEIDALIDASNPKTIGDGLRVTLLAPFWKRISEADVEMFVFFFTQITWKSFGKMRKERLSGYKQFMDHMFELLPDIRPTDDSPFSSLLHTIMSISDEQVEEVDKKPDLDTMFLLFSQLDLGDLGDLPAMGILKDNSRRLIQPFKDHHFFEGFDRQGLTANISDKKYLSIHPLVPLLLRAEPDWREDLLSWREFSKKAFFTYYGYRSKDWPMQYQYWNSVWDDAREEANLDFFNYASAALIFLQQERGDAVHDTIVMRTMMGIHRGVLGDVSRQNIMVQIWDAALKILLSREEEVKEENSRNANSTTSPWSFKNFMWWNQQTPHVATNGRNNYELPLPVLLFSIRLIIIHISCFLINHYHGTNNTKQREYLSLFERLYEDIVLTGVPEEADSIFMTPFLEKCLWNARVAAGKISVDLDEFWTRRQDIMRFITGHYGVETVPESQIDMFHLPVDVNAQSAQIARLLPLTTRIRAAIDEERLEEARKLVDEAMLVEINEAGNVETNKATLLRYRSEVDEKQGNWEDALLNYDEAELREDQAVRATGGQPAKSGYMQTLRSMHRDRLIRKIQEQEDGRSHQA